MGNMLENYEYRLSEEARYLKEAEEKKRKEEAEREEFYENIDRFRKHIELEDSEVSRKIHETYNDYLQTALEAVYITSIGGDSLSQTDISIASSAIKNYIEENGGAVELIRKKSGKTHLLDAIFEAVRNGAEGDLRAYYEADEDEEGLDDEDLETEETEEEDEPAAEDDGGEEKTDDATEETPAEADEETSAEEEPATEEEAPAAEESGEKSEEELMKELEDEANKEDETAEETAPEDEETPAEEETSSEEPAAEEGEEESEDAPKEDEASAEEEPAAEEEAPSTEETPAEPSEAEAAEDAPADATDTTEAPDAAPAEETEDADPVLDTPDTKETIEALPRNKEDMFKELESTPEVDDAVAIISKRISDAETEFIQKNAEDKKKIENIVDQVNDRIQAVNSDTTKPEDEVAAEIAQLQLECTRDMNAVHEGRSKTVFEEMVQNNMSYIMGNNDLRNVYIKEGKIDMKAVLESTKVMYGFLEFLNTMQLEDVDADYVKRVVKGYRERK